MLKNSPFYGAKAKQFYGHTLGVQVDETGGPLLALRAGNGYAMLIYERPGHRPADDTVLNFPVDEIEVAVDRLREAGVCARRRARVAGRRR